ncbi:MAG TPA: hypothetical protein VGB66_09570, partial [Longimicrobium sp.]
MSWFNYRGRVQSVPRNWDAGAPAPRQALLESLYAWERRLRGYDLFPSPVQLEPVFLPFDRACEAGEWDEVRQPRDAGEGGLCHLPLLLPLEQTVTPAQMASYLAALRALRHPFALEIVADASSIRYQISCVPEDESAALSALRGAFPLAHGPEAMTQGSAATGDGDALMRSLEPLAGGDLSGRIVDLGLAQAVYCPLPPLESLSPDTHGALVAALGALEEGEA